MLSSAKKGAETFEIAVPKMMCNHCIGRVRGALLPFVLDGDEKNLKINFNPENKKSPKTATIKVGKGVTGDKLVEAVCKLVALDEGVRIIEKPAVLFSDAAKGKKKPFGKPASHKVAPKSTDGTKGRKKSALR